MLSPAQLSRPPAHTSELQRRFAAPPRCPCTPHHPSPLHGHMACLAQLTCDRVRCARMGGKRPKGVGMSRPNKKKVAVDKAMLEAAKVLATKPPPPRSTTMPAPQSVSTLRPCRPARRSSSGSAPSFARTSLSSRWAIAWRATRRTTSSWLAGSSTRGGGAGSAMSGSA